MLPSNVWKIAGDDQDGPNVVVLGGTHGDEITGLELVRRLLRKLGVLNKAAGAYERCGVLGNLFLGFGNIDAILRGTRAACAGERRPQLNRV